MEEFYKQASETADQVVIDCWINAVNSVVKQGKQPSAARCYLKFKPSEAAIRALETDKVKVTVIHEPGYHVKGSDSPPYTQDSYFPEGFIIKFKD